MHVCLQRQMLMNITPRMLFDWRLWHLWCMFFLILGVNVIHAYEGQNLAFRMRTNQSSTGARGVSSRAVDGDNNSNYFTTGHCTHTLRSYSPWWRVDLAKEFSVSHLIITNRVDCCSSRLANFEIRIGNSLADNGNKNPKCDQSYSMPYIVVKNISCPTPMKGRYVNIRIPGWSEILTLCEVEIYANGSRDLALDKKTAQSSTAHSGLPSRAVDGNKYTHYVGGHCTHTLTSFSPWWWVDLGEEFPVSYLTITNRGDCCSLRLSDFEIRIGNSLAENGNQNPKCGGLYSLSNAETKNISCPSPMLGRYVNIRIPGPANVLTLCEVEVYAQGEIMNPLGDITYWLAGSTVILPWTIIYRKVDIVSSTLSYTKFGSGRSTTLAKSLYGANLTSINSSYNIEEQAKLVFPNANLGHNGTYSLDLFLRGSDDGAKKETSNIAVIILVKPVAQIKCLKKDSCFFCECKSDVGNPPPLAYWTKDCKHIGDFGYRMKVLTIFDITKENPAIYSCNVKSHNLTDQKNIILEAPRMISFYNSNCNHHGCIILTCKAYGILPTVFNITFNGGKPEILPNGIKRIDNFTKDSVGVYKCIAFNTIGSSSMELKIGLNLQVAHFAKLSNADDSNTGTKWYIPLITCICGIFAGMILLFVIQWLRRRFRSSKFSDVAEIPFNEFQ